MKKKILLIILPLLILILVPLILLINGYIQQGKLDKLISWESLQGPPGGEVKQLIQNPYGHNELYATVSRSATQPLVDVYKSEDKGESWEIIEELKDVQVVSIAVFEDKLFACGGGVYYYDVQKNLKKILGIPPGSLYNKVIVSDNKLFATFISFSRKTKNVQIEYSDLTAGDFKWKKLSFSESELRDLVLPSEDIGFGYHIEVPNVLALGNIILANVAVIQESGSGQFSNDQLYISENFGETWSKVDLGKPADVIISNIIQDPNNPEHILLTLQHNIMHEFKSPISQLVKESYDKGKTWSPLTNLALESNAVMNVAILGSAYYLLSPYDSYMVKIDGSSYEQINMPKVKEFEEISFMLNTLLFDFDDPDIVYGKVGPIWSLGLIKSEDAMKTWKKMDRDIVASSRTIIAVHPEDPQTIFASGNIIQESYLTRDGGKNWEPFSPVNSVDEVRVDPHDPSHILVISEMTGLYESNDTGRTFKKINQDFSSAKIFDFEIAKDNSGKIYVSNLGTGISEYDPSLGGDAWRYLIGSPDYVYDFEIDPEDSDVLYAGYSPKIFENYSSIWRYSKSQKENFGWTELFRFENSRGITSIRFDPQNPNRIYAGVIGQEGEIYVSNDKGKSWNKLNDNFTMLTVWGQPQLITDPGNPSIAYIGTWLAGTWKTTDAGKTWTLLEGAPISATALSLDNKNTDVVYLGDRSSPTVWKSADGGQTWKEVANFAKDGALLAMRVLADGDTVYASTFYPALRGGKLYKSIDAGATWRDITGILPPAILDIAVDQTNSDILYLTTNIHGAYKSTDGGENWSKMLNFPDVGAYDIETDSDNPAILYTAARGGSLPSWFTEIAGVMGGITFTDEAGVYRSADSGETWTKMLTTTASCRVIRRHPDNPDLFFTNDVIDGLKMSKDGGDTWVSLNDGLDKAILTAVAVNGDKIYVGTQGNGVYSGDLDFEKGTVVWQAQRSNKPVPQVYNLQIRVDPTNSNNLFVTSYPGGMYASVNGGKTFSDRNAITPSVVVDDPVRQGYYTFAFDPNNPTEMWEGTWGKGIYKSYNSMILNIPVNLFGKHINQIVVNPDDSNTVYVASQEGVFVTKDDGKSWQAMNDGLATLDIRSLKISSVEHPPFRDDFEDGKAEAWQLESGWSVINDNGNYVLQGTEHKWANAGLESWIDYTFETKVKLISGQGMQVNYRVSTEGRYAVGLHEGGLYLMKTIFPDSHTNLANAEVSLAKNKWNKIKIVGNDNNIKVYVNDVLRINYTDNNPLLNGRIAFESFENSRVYVDDIQVTPTQGDTLIYVGTAGYGIYKLNPATKKWQNLGRTLGSGWWSAWDRRMYQFSSILFDPDIPGRIYYGHFPSGFFISQDNGKSWQDSSLGIGNDGIFSLSVRPDNHDILFAGTYNGVIKSTDRGKTWELKNNGMPSEQWPYTVAIDSDNPDIMYASTKNGQNKGFCDRNMDTFCGVVMKSTDGGESWFEIMKGLNPISEFYTLIIYPANHKILFLSTNRGVYLSKNKGESWQPINNGLPTGSGLFNLILPLLGKFLPLPPFLQFSNQVRDNVAENLALTPDNKYLILGLVNYGAWKADLTKLENIK